MSIITTQQLTQYYEKYRQTEVTFNRQVIAATGLMPRNMYLKVLDRQLPCTVFSSSLTSARVIANIKANFFLDLKRPNTRLALRWCFKLAEKVEPITFFVPCRVTGSTHFNVQKPGVQMLTIEFTQRPPNDLIEILGSLLEANWNSQQRREERIVISPENMKRLGMDSREALLLMGETTRHCILRDLSFIGAEVLASGLTEKDAGRPMTLKLAKGEQAAEITLAGTITRVEEVGGRKDIMAVAIEYAADTPISYKLLINTFITSARKGTKDEAVASAPPPDTRQTEPDVPQAEPDAAQTAPEPRQPDGFLPSPPHPRLGPKGEPSENG